MRTTDLSKGNPAKVLILFALPMILSVTLQQVYNIADSAIAGRMINSLALSAVSESYPITAVYLSVASGMGIGIGVITSRYFGAKDYSNTKSAITTGLLFTLILGIIMTIFGILFARPILKLIDTPSDIMKDSVLYLRFYSGGIIFTYLYNVIASVFQSLGNSKTPLYFLVFSTILNIILDILFVGPCDMEVLGLALGTFIAQAIAMICSLLFLVINMKKTLISNEVSKIWSRSILSQILVIAIPSIIQGSTISIGNFIVQKRINHYGSALVGGYGAAYKLCYVVVNIFVAYSNAISNYTAQNIGAGKHKRITAGFKWSLLICLIFAIVMSGIILLFKDYLLLIFMNKDAKSAIDIKGNSAMDYGRVFCYIVAPFFIFMGIKIPSDGILKGSKDMASFMLGTFADLILRVVLSFVLSHFIGYKGIFMSWPIGWGVGALISATMYFVGRWKRKACFPSKEEYMLETLQ